MHKKDTCDLQTELISAPDLDRFLAENQDNFYDTTIAVLLMNLFEKTNLSKSALAKRSGISNVYLHQIFSGERHPSRNRILCLCFGLAASLEDSQRLLERGGFAPLHAKNKRDAIIIFGLTHGMSLDDINDRLFSEREETLC